MRQRDLVVALDQVIARSTLANVEVGRENPSPRLWEAICTHLPEWVSALEPHYRGKVLHWPEAPFELSGPFELAEATYVYNFREHPAPEEIIQVRRVVATRDGADGYGLKLSNNSGRFDIETEALFGGWVAHHARHVNAEQAQHLTRFHFDRTLRAGQVHEFATRAWVSDHDPAQMITVAFTRPTHAVSITLNFYADRCPQRAWHFGPLADHRLEPSEGAGCESLVPLAEGCFTLRLEQPLIGHLYGVGWTW